ncbi:unnamed protein product [Hymenolepis diminuta]|uniref:Uncharacterized protein n=1 Tax=Hymenolepis diminuta TaxID=6216 RepID=A0A564Z5T2_HYMDI|nr:unnamed protein product [Hymenolepis diminuta]
MTSDPFECESITVVYAPTLALGVDFPICNIALLEDRLLLECSLISHRYVESLSIRY